MARRRGWFDGVRGDFPLIKSVTAVVLHRPARVSTTPPGYFEWTGTTAEAAHTDLAQSKFHRRRLIQQLALRWKCTTLYLASLLHARHVVGQTPMHRKQSCDRAALLLFCGCSVGHSTIGMTLLHQSHACQSSQACLARGNASRRGEARLCWCTKNFR